MATSNHERIGKALELLNEGLRPFVERELKAVHGDQVIAKAREALRPETQGGPKAGEINWDTQALLSVMWDQWNGVFGKILGYTERSIVSELREVRNRWAHQKSFTLDDTYRGLDSIQRLLTAISSPEAAEIERQKQEVLRQRFEEQTRRESKKAAVVPIEGQPAGGLRPWREVVTPHPDVASGRYQQAEFAADLGQVDRGEGADEYRDARAFFSRTFLTEGLKGLLVGAVERLGNRGGDPVVKLQTNFGGGKTHSMLALFHLFGGRPASELPGVESVWQEAGVSSLPTVRRAVLVGTAISPGQAQRKPDGTIVNTMWGDLAWRLLGRAGYMMLAEADERGVSPGSDVLRELLVAASPSLILIDEWVAFVRQLYGVNGLPAGSFDANLTFAQALTEAVKAVPGSLLVASIPASDIEIGGEGGREALTRLENTFGRLESAWRPASAEEGFEIVRRRLFQPISDPASFPLRDAAIRGFVEMYRSQASEFPSNSRESDYERRMQAAYPIHPELFDRLYNDWSALDRFQRTRGVLRLMSAVIHALWERDDRSLLILPASVPVDDPAVQFELTRYMEDPWVPVIEKDVDGPHSLPLHIDRDNPNLGRYSACRRVARTIYLGSAPTLHSANKGLDDRQIKLGCAQPGESLATFGDALRRLTDGATHLYLDGRRYWFSTQPSVNRLAQDRAVQQTQEAVEEEILARLRLDRQQRADFIGGLYIAPASADLPDEREARLVILGPTQPHSAKTATSPARLEAARLLESRGNSPRRYRNSLLFLAPDATRLKELEQAVRQFLAWKSIEDERETLNLDSFQTRQTHTKREQADETVRGRLPETFAWLIVPGLPTSASIGDAVEWQEIRLQGPESLAARASRKLRNEELLVTTLAGTRLRMELDRIPLWRGEDVSIKQLAEDFAQYLYLPRLRDSEVLLGAIRDGLALTSWEQDTFAYAEGRDSLRPDRYKGLKTGQSQNQPILNLDSLSLLVQSSVARRQLDSEEAARRPTQPAVRWAAPDSTTATSADPSSGVQFDPTTQTTQSSFGLAEPPPTLQPATLQRFYGSVTLDPTRLSRDVGSISEAVIQHLASLLGANVKITLEIEAQLPDGAPENLIRTVSENCRTLRFEQFGFEK